MSSVIVRNISGTTTEKQVADFFSFCGKVIKVVLSPAGDDSKTQVAKVTFQKAAAVSTAVLLSDAELDGHKVTIEKDPESTTPLESGEAAAASGDHEDIDQEEKPRSAIIAEYLAHGYVLSDKVVARSLEFDNQHGISSRFNQFLKDLDSKYHVTEKAQAADKAYGVSDKAKTHHEKFRRYLDDALSTPTGSRVRGYYSDIVKNATDVHNEARRLADLKKANATDDGVNLAAPSVSTGLKH
jgi:RNA recognition motif-containing protein